MRNSPGIPLNVGQKGYLRPLFGDLVDRVTIVYQAKLLDRWSQDVSADVQDRQDKVDGLYRRMVDAVQTPRVTFEPIDLRDEIQLPRADAEHTCPQCGARARIDIHDPMRGRIHLSCDSCFKMWQQRVESTEQSDEPFMRD